MEIVYDSEDMVALQALLLRENLLRVLSRRNAEQYVDAEPYAIISFRDPGSECPNFQTDSNRLGTLLFELADLDRPSPSAPTFTSEDACRVHDFVEKMRPKVNRFVIHCEAGVSRSRGCALALGLMFDDPFPHHLRGYPNLLIASHILEEHARRGGPSLAIPAMRRKVFDCAKHPGGRLARKSQMDDTVVCQECGTPAGARIVNLVEAFAAARADQR